MNLSIISPYLVVLGLFIGYLALGEMQYKTEVVSLQPIVEGKGFVTLPGGNLGWEKIPYEEACYKKEVRYEYPIHTKVLQIVIGVLMAFTSMPLIEKHFPNIASHLKK